MADGKPAVNSLTDTCASLSWSSSLPRATPTVLACDTDAMSCATVGAGASGLALAPLWLAVRYGLHSSNA
jgi:hypothetical protein